MTTRVHDEEPDTGREVARALLDGQFPAVAGAPLVALSNTGSDNALFRLGTDLVMRLPRSPGAAQGLRVELDCLPHLGDLSVVVPEVVHAGTPQDAYPFEWAVLRWIDGMDAWEARHRVGWFGAGLGHDLAAMVQRLRGTSIPDAPARQPGERGGPLRALDDRVHRWLDRADGLVDERAVLRLWDRCLEAAADEAQPVLLHGDLIPGNLLLSAGRLTAVIDWGGLGVGDPAQDLDPMWSVLDEAGARAFSGDLEVDEASWLRACGFALEQAIGGVIYYTPRQHSLGAVMQRTLDRLLSGHNPPSR